MKKVKRLFVDIDDLKPMYQYDDCYGDSFINDDAAQVAQAQLPRNGLGCFQVGLENRVLEIARTDITTRVNVHRGQRLGLVNDQVTT